jgi:hypothetical protein
MTRHAAFLFLFTIGCTKSEQPYKTMYIQLEDARMEARENTQRAVDCFKRILERDTLKSDTAFAGLFNRLIKVTKTRDSLIETLPVVKTEQFVEKLERFKSLIIEIHNPRYRPQEYLESNFMIEIDIIKKEFHLLPPEIHNELFKCIVERWTKECLSSLLQHWAIDDPC